MPPSRSPLPWLVLILLLAVARVSTAEPVEATDAVGPSARPANSAPSAYPRATPPAKPQPQAEAATSDEGRRLHLGSEGSDTTKPSRLAGGQSADLLHNFAKSSGATALAALAFVVGLFMLMAWFVKRGMPNSAQVLPAEAVRLLGRVPLGSRQFGQLLQLGNKLVLVHVTQAGVEKLAEIDDPQEVVRLLAVCSKTSSKGSQKEFEEIFGQFAKEKTEPGFLGSDTPDGGRRYA
ncbi:flagellar biosynthetic protein FliO [Aeoliella sp. ICT_H6.2]|uniref:Flagellar biosynthetic protein FliO n=1 Tax=Aeoliella straminimaris TaxID=2954799 RepID=A0A9X2FE58_9BACT|nr:flagellar biosynthetic protein FliO [Aeoliella straminimaris]MCO6047345.1 flagellar biosynthetic protein FliO [Aeoliella straminimaris]